MPVVPASFEGSLARLADGRALAGIARRYLAAWPDLHLLAGQAAADCLQRHTGRRLAPDYVWWHSFGNAYQSSKTVTGWEHIGPPVSSLRFTDLMVRRFDLGLQEGPGLIDQNSGFYRQGPNGRWYDDLSEVPILPSAVQAEFWKKDFATEVREQTQRFWQVHAGDFLVLARVHWLAQIEQCVAQGLLSLDDRQALRHYAGVAEAEPTLAQLQAPQPVSPLRVEQFEGAWAGRLYTLQAPGGRTVLYMPMAKLGLRGFDSVAAMLGWVRDQLHGADSERWLGELIGHKAGVADGVLLAQLRQRAGTQQAPRWPFAKASRVANGLFDAMAEAAQAQMQADQAHLVSNSDLRKALWRGYLGAFLHIAGGLAPAAWPISLAVVGAGIARLVLDIDAAAHARSREARRQALFSAVADGICVVLGIVDAGLGVSALGYRAPPHEAAADPSQWGPVQWAPGELEDVAGNDVLPSPSDRPGLLRGITLGADGQTWIMLDNLPYRVRYSPELGHWLVVRPEAPFAFTPLRPVGLDSTGQWRWLGRPRLQGGMPGGLAWTSSPFWDFYMQGDEALAEQLSDLVLQRQRGILEAAGLQELAADASPLVDEHGYDFIEVQGVRHYSYRQQGEFYNDPVRIYTDELSEANNLFRHGTSEFGFADGDIDAYLERLADSLETLPRDNRAVLWRGGHISRGTSGTHFRSGQWGVGDVLVSTDVASFTENPYIARHFATGSRETAGGVEEFFDDSSLVFELPYQQYEHGVPVAPFSHHDFEAEVVFSPGRYFRIEQVGEVRGTGFRFVEVKLREVPAPASGPVYDLRTGEVFDRQAWAARVGNPALLQRFFPITT